MVFSVFAETSYSQVPDSPTPTPHPTLSPSLTSLVVSVDVEHHVYLLASVYDILPLGRKGPGKPGLERGLYCLTEVEAIIITVGGELLL